MGVSGWGVQAWGADSESIDGPQITIVSPAPGLIPGTFAQASNTPLIFDVTDITPDLQIVLLWISFDAGANADMVHDDAGFFAKYASGSSRVAITNGYRYTIYRDGGWPAALTDLRLTVRPFDATGNYA